MKRALLILILLAGPCPGFGTAGDSPPLDGYIRMGLKGNLALRQREFSLEKSLAALAEARSFFYPTLGVAARYSRAGGGRIIDFPVGDLLNPIHASLNELFHAQGMPSSLPTDLANERIPFLRPSEQETRLRLTQPIFVPGTVQQLKIRASLARAEAAALNAFKRKLVLEIKTAYFQYLKADCAADLLQQIRSLLEENRRISRSLLENGKATEDILLRAEAELAGVAQKTAQAEKDLAQARAYFNFLLNRPFDAAVAAEPLPTAHRAPSSLQEISLRALAKRDEFAQIDHAIRASAHHVRLAASGRLPSLGAAIDYGFQGETYRFAGNDDYWMASLLLEWTLFDGGRSRAQRIQARLDKRKLESQRLELERTIRLQVQEEYRGLEAAELMLEATRQREKSSRGSFAIVAAKFRSGMAPQFEYMDAQTVFAEAAMAVIVARYDCLIQQARLEQAAALVDLERYEQGEIAE
ncbi:MAG: TolC family protein [Candidatus Aminicenantes bacterium]|nr:TolC family protein [Candidatus Aminicenantes bacterium]